VHTPAIATARHPGIVGLHPPVLEGAWGGRPIDPFTLRTVVWQSNPAVIGAVAITAMSNQIDRRLFEIPMGLANAALTSLRVKARKERFKNSPGSARCAHPRISCIAACATLGREDSRACTRGTQARGTASRPTPFAYFLPSNFLERRQIENLLTR